MRRLLLVLAIVLAAGMSPVQAQPQQANEDLIRQGVQACAFGGAVLGVTSLLVLYPAIMGGGVTNVPLTQIVLGNTLFGCGIAAVGAAAARGVSFVYDNVFASAPAAEPVPAPADGSAT